MNELECPPCAICHMNLPGKGTFKNAVPSSRSRDPKYLEFFRYPVCDRCGRNRIFLTVITYLLLLSGAVSIGLFWPGVFLNQKKDVLLTVLVASFFLVWMVACLKNVTRQNKQMQAWYLQYKEAWDRWPRDQHFRPQCMICGISVHRGGPVATPHEFLVEAAEGRGPLVEQRAYRCRACGSTICQKCAKNNKCVRCGGSIYDLVSGA